jgi:hypothetical protein
VSPTRLTDPKHAVDSATVEAAAAESLCVVVAAAVTSLLANAFGDAVTDIAMGWSG